MLDRKEFNKQMDQVRLEEMKEFAKYLEDFIKINANVRNMPVHQLPTKEELDKIEAIPIRREGRDYKEVGDELVNDVLSKSMLLQHPRYFSLVTAQVSPYSLAGSLLTDIYNPNIAGFNMAPCASIIEEKLIKWMGSLAGFDPEKCGGVFTSGGSLSNLTGIIAARENMLPGRVDLPKGAAFFSDQAHSSVVKGLRLSGLRSDQLYKIESDDEFKMDLDKLELAIQDAISKGLKPYLLVGTIGTTNTGSIDPLSKMADLAEKYHMWFHVDGAYGGSILLSDIYRNLVHGLERADSFSWDTHKWSLQTYSCSTIIAKDKQTFITAFNEHPEYLADVRDMEHNDGWDLGIEMSRPARCIKLWYTVQAMGTDGMADIVDYAFYHAAIAAKRVAALPNWRIISKPSCGAVNFRFEPKEVDPSKYDDLNAAISKAIIDDGFAYVLTTVLKGQRVIRFSLLNGNMETEDVYNTIEKLDVIANNLIKDFK